MNIDLDHLTRFTQALVRQMTLPGQEAPAIRLAADEMKSLAFDHIFEDVNGSLVGIIEGAESGPTLLMDAHCDTVGVAPGVPWKHDPFGAIIEGDRLYGRGSSDMKGAVAAMIHAAAAADRSKIIGRVVISISVMEEVMEGLALKTVMDVTQPDYVVIGESTNLNIARGGRGRAEIHLETIGQPSHSSAPHLGVNAVHPMIAAIQAIEARPVRQDPLLGPAIMALTDIISDPFPGHSVIPSRCRVTYDRRLLADETSESVLSSLTTLPALDGVQVTIGRGEYSTYTGAILSGLKFFPAWTLAEDHSFVEATLVGLRETGLNPSLGAYHFCTNAAYSAGVAGVPTIGFGPSAEGQAHVVDEYLELDQLNKVALGYLGIIRHLLR